MRDSAARQRKKHGERIRERQRVAYRAKAEDNRQAARERMRAARLENPEPFRARDRARYAANPARRIKKNRARYTMLENQRRARKLQQTCGCCSEQQFADLYAFAHAIGDHVDHHTALALGGLHCMKNLQLLTPEQHQIKTRCDLAAIAVAKRRASLEVL